MPEESTTPELVELTRRWFEPMNRGDFDATMSFFAPAGVWDSSADGLGVHEGHAAIRRFFEDWRAPYVEYQTEVEEVLDLGNGVTLAVLIQRGRPVGTSGRVRNRYAVVLTWVEGMVVRGTTYQDIAEARAAAERLAESRG
jgi:ketosteroid isomerase-like protein